MILCAKLHLIFIPTKGTLKEIDEKEELIYPRQELFSKHLPMYSEKIL